MKLLVTIEKDEDGWFVVECPALPGCVSQGHTREEALANIRDAIRLSIKSRAELGLPLPVEIDAVEVECDTAVPAVIFGDSTFRRNASLVATRNFGYNYNGMGHVTTNLRFE